MPLLKHGFLGTEGERIQQQILKKYAELFGHLRDFNDICHEYLSGLRIDRQAEIEVFTIAYFIRGLKTFQSLILLLERGMLDDVRVLGRTLLHTHFRLAALANDPTVLKRIRTSSLLEQKRRLESYKSGKRKVPANATKVDLDQLIAQAESQLQKLGGSGINEKELAKIGGRLRDYDEAYAILSDAVHTSISDVLPSMKFGHKGNFLGYIYGQTIGTLRCMRVICSRFNRRVWLTLAKSLSDNCQQALRSSRSAQCGLPRTCRAFSIRNRLPRIADYNRRSHGSNHPRLT
jgi:hypothetical protein